MTTDEELFQAGRRAFMRGQCNSVIVATNPEGIRNYHNCVSSRDHGDSKHYCGCGQEWQGHTTAGPLTDVVRAGEALGNGRS